MALAAVAEEYERAKDWVLTPSAEKLVLKVELSLQHQPLLLTILVDHVIVFVMRDGHDRDQHVEDGDLCDEGR